MTSVKKIKVALLALVAALVIAIPTSAFAADSTLTIQGKSDKHTYDVYEIFTGELSGTSLGKIQWAEGIDKTKLPAGYTNAADVADQLSKSTLAAKDFAEAMKTSGAFPATPYATMTPGADNKYTATVKDNGYYLIQDRDGSQDDKEAYTSYILLKGTDTGVVNAKDDVPTVEKEVMEDKTSKWGETGDFDLTQPINYRLIGTLPSNYDDYDWYEYVFNDDMSDGLDLVKGSVHVSLAVDGDLTAMTEGDLDEYFDVAYDDAKHDLTVTAKEGTDKNYLKQTDAKYGDKIVVTYQATLNANAVIGETGNPNNVDLDYSNNPNSDGKGDKGKTPKDYCVVFTYQLDNTKTGEGQHKDALPGAEFQLTNSEGKLAQVNKETGKLEGWVSAPVNTETSTTTLVSDENGKFNVLGLDEGTYTLTETKQPEGYALLQNPITFTIAAKNSMPQNDGVGDIEELSIQIGTATPVQSEGQDLIDGKVKQSIGNTLSANLPTTGGIGTTIFTIVGIALIVAAAAIMVIRRRNAAAIQ